MIIRAPLISSRTDIISEHKVCITMALHGGIGIIHANFSTPADQANEVSEVKRHKQGFILSPQCIRPDDSILELKRRKYKLGGIPVTQNGKVRGKLLG